MIKWWMFLFTVNVAARKMIKILPNTANPPTNKVAIIFAVRTRSESGTLMHDKLLCVISVVRTVHGLSWTENDPVSSSFNVLLTNWLLNWTKVYLVLKIINKTNLQRKKFPTANASVWHRYYSEEIQHLIIKFSLVQFLLIFRECSCLNFLCLLWKLRYLGYYVLITVHIVFITFSGILHVKQSSLD